MNLRIFEVMQEKLVSDAPFSLKQSNPTPLIEKFISIPHNNTQNNKIQKFIYLNSSKFHGDKKIPKNSPSL